MIDDSNTKQNQATLG